MDISMGHRWERKVNKYIYYRLHTSNLRRVYSAWADRVHSFTIVSSYLKLDKRPTFINFIYLSFGK